MLFVVMAGNDCLPDFVDTTEEIITSETINADNASEKMERLFQLPITRIKSIIKLDPDVTLASQDAVVLIAKATVRLSLRVD